MLKIENCGNKPQWADIRLAATLAREQDVDVKVHGIHRLRQGLGPLRRQTAERDQGEDEDAEPHHGEGRADGHRGRDPRRGAE